MSEFMKFLKEYGVIGLAIGVIIGTKAGELVKTIVDGLLMPIINPILAVGGGNWQTSTLDLGPFHFMIGAIIGALIITILENGCSRLNLQPDVRYVIIAGIILGVAALNSWKARE